MSDANDAIDRHAVCGETEAGSTAANRICGECTACCTVMGVRELNKAPYQPCPHECGRCAIYESRPATCRSYRCAWLLGSIEGGEECRPDKLGLLLNRDQLAGRSITTVHQLRLGAAKEPDKKNLLHKISLEMPVVLIEYETGRCEVISPDRQARASIRQLLEED
ncbi:MAG TPA: hypothetical protein VMF30_10075 [Pirellulales bacterium]|nr:hypothetical protein [Pirellulales bacterium]